MQIAPFFTTSVNPINAPAYLDANAASNALVIQCEGSSGKPLANGTYVDSSANGAAITVTSTPAQGSFGPFTGASSLETYPGVNANSPNSVYAAANIGGYALGGSDNYTFEAFVYIKAWVGPSPTYFPVFQFETNVTTSDGKMWIALSPAKFWCSRHGSSAATMSVSYSFSLNTWYHIAVTRQSGTTRFFVNGVQQTTFIDGSATTANGAAYSSNGAMVACLSTVGSGSGFISGLRFVKGTALYTSTFSPPTSKLTAVSGTELLMHFDNGGVVDSVGKNNIRLFGDAARSFTRSRYGVASLRLDGSGDWGRISPQTMPNLFTGDFTIEWWQYCTTLSVPTILGISNFAQISGQIGMGASVTAAGVINFYFGPAQNSAIIATAAGTITTNNWQHVAITRSGSTFRVFVNGTQRGTATVATTYSQATRDYTIGTYFDSANNLPATGTVPFPGFIDELRVTTMARYTANFTPPEGPSL